MRSRRPRTAGILRAVEPRRFQMAGANSLYSPEMQAGLGGRTRAVGQHREYATRHSHTSFRNLMPGSRIVRFLHTFGTASYTSSHTLEVVAVGADLPCCKPFRHLAVEFGWFVSFSTTAATAGDLATG